MPQKQALMGIFSHLDDLSAVIESLKKRRSDFTVFTPARFRRIEAAVGQKPSSIRYFTLFGGIVGMISGLALAVFTVLEWKFIVSGRPILPWAPFVIVAFEFLILGGVLATFAGMLVSNRLPQRRLPDYYDPRFSNDRFGVLVRFDEGNHDMISNILRAAGAEEVHELEG